MMPLYFLIYFLIGYTLYGLLCIEPDDAPHKKPYRVWQWQSEFSLYMYIVYWPFVLVMIGYWYIMEKIQKYTDGMDLSMKLSPGYWIRRLYTKKK